jgi:hypothetical protein
MVDAITPLRHQWRADIRDEDVAWIVQLYDSRAQLEWFNLIVDGDGVFYGDLAERYGCALHEDTRLMRLATGHRYVIRLLETCLAGNEPYCMRVDPDARMWRRFAKLPAFSCLFGTLETASNGCGVDIVPVNAQGGCLVLTRDVAQAMTASGLLTWQSCCVDASRTWARCEDMARTVASGRISDDFVLSWLAHELAVPVVECAEIRSRWRRPTPNTELRYAVTHPHNLPRDGQAFTRIAPQPLEDGSSVRSDTATRQTAGEPSTECTVCSGVIGPPEPFHAVACSLFQVGRDRYTAVTPERVMDLDEAAARVFAACAGCRTVDEYAQDLAERTALSPVTARAQIQRLVELGLLVPLHASLQSSARGDTSNDTHPPVSTVVIITRNRPQLLERGLRSAMAQAARWGEQPAFVVVDDSDLSDRSTEAATRRAARRGDFDVVYYGRDEVAALRGRLAADGLDSDLLTLAFRSASIGGNRNLALLLSAGQHVVMIDDDILCQTWEWDEHEPGVIVGGHGDAAEWRFFASRARALEAVTRTDRDLFGMHGRVLGRDLQDLIRTSGVRPVVSQACGHMVAALVTGQGRVRLTMTGLAGDSARYCHSRLLFNPRIAGTLVDADENVVATALSSREVHNIVRGLTVTHDSACMSYCLGVQNTDLLPPFVPLGRGEDSVFGAMLALADPAALSAYLPLGVIHDSIRDAKIEDVMVSARQTRLCEFLLYLRARILPAITGTSIEQRLRQIGQTFTSIAAWPEPDFRHLLVQAAFQIRAAHLRGLEEHLIRHPAAPPSCGSALARYRDAFRHAADAPDFVVPIEFRDDGAAHGGVRTMKAFLADFGRLTSAWPEIWRAAVKMNDGNPPA